jgi:thioesterase domain-containing protein
VAHVVPMNGEALDTVELQALLRERLPEFMLPAAFVQVARLPLTSNGKVDRGALHAADADDAEPQRGHVAPRTRDEEAIALIWRRVLRVESVGVHDDFFELGGNSLLAVRMLSEVGRELGRRTTVASFLQGGSTVAGLASLLDTAPASGAGQTSTAPVANRRPALFAVFSDESSMVALRHLIRALSAERTVVGLLPPRRNRRFDPGKTVVELATELVEEIRVRDPHGPYCLCGHSLGGLLAYEIAGQLRSAGEEVAWLGLLDTAAPDLCRLAATRRGQLEWRVQRFVAHARLVGLPAAVRELVVRRGQRLRYRLGLPLPPDDWDGPGALRVAMTYSVVAHDVPLDVFATSEWMPEAGIPGLGWEELHRGPLRYHPMPGDHGSLLEEPHVDRMLEIFARRLREVEGGRGREGVHGQEG